MATTISGKRVLLSGALILEENEITFVDESTGTTLELSFSGNDNQMMGGGKLNQLEGRLPADTPNGKHVYGFGVGENGVYQFVRVCVADVNGYRLVTYTVTEETKLS